MSVYRHHPPSVVNGRSASIGAYFESRVAHRPPTISAPIAATAPPSAFSMSGA